jgi:hypothetical protein
MHPTMHVPTHTHIHHPTHTTNHPTHRPFLLHISTLLAPKSPAPALQDTATDDLTAADYYADSYGHFGIHEEMIKDEVCDVGWSWVGVIWGHAQRPWAAGGEGGNAQP